MMWIWPVIGIIYSLHTLNYYAAMCCFSWLISELSHRLMREQT